MLAVGLMMVSMNPTSVDVQSVVLGNILAISDEDVTQVVLIAGISIAALALRWKDLMLAFFDETQARAVGLDPMRLRIFFFVLLSACTVAALQTVGAVLVIAMVVTPRRDRLSAHRPFRRHDHPVHEHRGRHQRRWRLCELFSRRRDRRSHRGHSVAPFPRRFRLRAEARAAGGAAQRAEPRMSAATDWLLHVVLSPMQHEFMQRGMAVALLVGIVCAMLSCFLILKGWSLMADAVSHAVLPGMVLASVLKIPLIFGAFVAGLTCAVGTGYLKQNSRVKEDAVMGIVFSGMFALGLVLYVKIESDQHLLHILFGDLLGVTWPDVVQTAAIVIPSIAAVFARRRDLVVWCFDPAHARAIGLPVGLLHFGLLSLIALTIVASLKAVGIILVIAMMIAPGAIGFLLTKRFSHMLGVAVTSACLACIAGTLLSFHIDSATGPTIVVVQAGLFVVAVLATSRRPRPVPA